MVYALILSLITQGNGLVFSGCRLGYTAFCPTYPGVTNSRSVPITTSGLKGWMITRIPWTARLSCSLLLTFREPHCPGPLLGREQTVASGVPRLGHVIRGASFSTLSLTSLIHETAVAIFVTVGHGVVQLPHQVPRRTILPRGEAHELFHWKRKTKIACAVCRVSYPKLKCYF